jgi:hypothetical protein
MKAILFLAAVLPAGAHVISMSSGDFRIDGNRATYEFRMPIYEIQHVKEPEKTLFECVQKTSRTVPIAVKRHMSFPLR